MSHEIENPSNDLYMLLSLHAQATLGFVKDVAAGTVYLKRQDAYVQLYAVEGCDLRAVCISDFPDVMRSLPPTPIEQPCTVEEEGTTERQARRLKTRKEIAEMTDSEDDEYKSTVMTAAPKTASRASLRGEQVSVPIYLVRATSREKPEDRKTKPKGTVGEELEKLWLSAKHIQQQNPERIC